METSLKSGGRKSSRWKRSSNLEEGNHRDGNVPPNWRTKIIVMETFLQTGGQKSSRWKCSSRFAGRFRWCFYWSWDLQDDFADVFIGRGICRTISLMFLLVVGFAGRFR